MTHQNIINVSAESVAKNAMVKYATTVVIDRALPDARDGLKPVHRRGLYTCHQLGLHANAKYRKLTAITGATMANFHPHGDSSITEALVRLSQSWNIRAPLMDIEGNNGSLDGDAPAAPRYLEARLTKVASDMFDDIQHVINMKRNYDNTMDEPEILPIKFPHLFINGISGIAVGYATDIPPHNPIEMIDAAIVTNQNPQITLDELMTHVPCPDFPTGGILSNLEGVKAIYETGKGSFTLRGRVMHEGNSIIVTEIPYGITKSDLLVSIDKAIVSQKLTERVKEIRDESEGIGVRIVIECVRGTDTSLLAEVLYKKSKLQVNVNAQCNAIVDKKPEILTLKRYLDVFLSHVRHIAYNTLKHEYESKLARLHLVEGYLRLSDITDDVIRCIKRANGKSEVITQLQSEFGFTNAQAEAIAMMRLHRISNQDLQALRNEFQTLTERLVAIKNIISSNESFTSHITDVLEQSKQSFEDTERKTTYTSSYEVVNADLSTLAVTSKVKVVVKPQGAQRMSEVVFQNNYEEYGQDVVYHEVAMTNQALIVFTRNGIAMQRIVDDLENVSLRQTIDDWYKTVPTFDSDDRIIQGVIADVNQLDGYIISITEQGMVKCQPLETCCISFGNKGYLKRSKVYNGLKREGDKVVHVEYVPSLSGTLTLTSGKRQKVIELATISVQGASGSGANALKVSEPLTWEFSHCEIAEEP